MMEYCKYVYTPKVMRMASWRLWMKLGLFLALVIPTVIQAQSPLVLTVGNTELQPIRYGMDYERLWFWYGSTSNKNQVAHWSVIDCDIEYIRVAINAGYELTEGSYNLSAYTNKIIPMMQYMQAANPDIKFFASPRPLDEAEDGVSWQPYPRWITGDTNNTGNFDLDWEKCAEYLVRYLRLMKSYGFKISYLDLTNEWQSNSGGRLTPSDARDISEYLDDYVANPPNPDPTDPTDPGIILPALVADDIPLLIAPSSWNFQQGASWINSLNSTRKRNAVDIAASHNTDKTGTAQQFADQARETLGDDVEIWNTELHGWKSTSNADEVTTFSFMIEAIRAGFTSVSGWLAIGTPSQGHSYILNDGSVTRNVKYFIFRKLSNTSNFGHALDINQPDELTSTAALIKDDLVTVWVNNASSSEVDVQIELGTYTNPSGQVLETRWSELIDLAGVAKTIMMTPGGSSFTATIAANSLHCFEVPLVGLISSQNISTQVPQNGSVDIDLTDNGNGEEASIYSIVSQPANGTLSGTAPDLTYTPNTDFAGTDTFTFMFNNGTSVSAIATATITVNELQLVANWRLDEASGTVLADATGNGHDGTLNAGTWVVAGGKLGGALDLNAGSEHATLPASAFETITSEITLSMWVYGDTTQPRANTTFYATNNENNRLLNIHLPFSDGTVFWDAGDSGGYDRISKLADEADYKGAWNLWTFIKDSSGQMLIYLNGQPWHSGTNLNHPIGEITTAYLGFDGGSRNYDGLIDDVRLYNYALSAEQALALYDGYTDNQTPTVSDVQVNLVQGRSAVVTFVGSDPEGAGLSYIIQNPPQHGTLSGTGSSMIYTPDADFSGSDSFTYVASDAFTDSAPATVSITVKPALLLAHWSLNDGTGTQISDVSGNGHHGTLTSGTWVNGLSGKALDFDGVSDLVDLPAAAFATIDNEITIALWVYGGDTQPAGDVTFYGTNNTGTRIINAHLPWDNSRVYWDASDRIDKAANSENFMGAWNHWAFTKNATEGEMKIFLNGELWHTATGKTNAISAITKFTLGAESAGNRHYDGIIDDVLLYDYALSDEQISSLYASYSGSLGYLDWISSYLGLTDTSVDLDPDGDGIKTGLEYILNGDPMTADRSIAPLLEVVGDSSSFSFIRAAGDIALTTTQIVQVSSNLSDWLDVIVDSPENINSVNITPLGGEMEQVTVIVDEGSIDGLDTSGALFFRLKAEF